MKKTTAVAATAVTLLGCLLFAGWSPKQEKPAVMITQSDLDWGLGPDAYPIGVRATIVDGDPDQPGPFIMRLKLPRKYKITPHWLTREERITVLSGSVALAVGERFDAAKLKTYAAGSYISLPARTRFFLTSGNGALLELYGEGPWEVNYVERSDDPRAQSASL